MQWPWGKLLPVLVNLIHTDISLPLLQPAHLRILKDLKKREDSAHESYTLTVVRSKYISVRNI